MQGRLDLNADLGESVDRWRSGEDRELLRRITSANVCTGAYAGTDDLIEATCEAAVESSVRIGAQVGYRDREGFGRRAMSLSTADLADEIAGQLDHLTQIAQRVGGQLAYVKPHGALYHRVHQDPEQAQALVQAMHDHDPTLAVMGMPGAISLDLARAQGSGVIIEGFADRGYGEDGGLLSRELPGALLTSVEDATTQALSLAELVDSLCVHSDSPGAIHLITGVRVALETRGIRIGPER